jgi:Carboxypeptidase regulatory-like domain
MKLAHRLIRPFRKTLRCAVLIVVVSGAANAAAVRGRLERRVAPNGNIVSVPGVLVTVYNTSLGRSPSSRTDSNGMYFLSVPAGTYTLEIWLSTAPGARPAAYQIQVVEPYTDVQPILLP